MGTPRRPLLFGRRLMKQSVGPGPHLRLEQAMPTSATRVERDTFGPIDVPADRLWGAQTQRSLQFFRISGEKMPRELIRALLLVKRAAATVNVELAGLPEETARAIVGAADEA